MNSNGGRSYGGRRKMGSSKKQSRKRIQTSNTLIFISLFFSFNLPDDCFYNFSIPLFLLAHPFWIYAIALIRIHPFVPLSVPHSFFLVMRYSASVPRINWTIYKVFPSLDSKERGRESETPSDKQTLREIDNLTSLLTTTTTTKVIA